MTTGASFRERASFQAGRAVLGLAILLALAAISLPLLDYPAGASASLAGLLLAGPPEILCLVAVALLGRKSYHRIVPGDRDSHAARWRYYAGLAGCLLNGLPLVIYAYAPSILPGGAGRYFILGVSDLVFVGSTFLMGGEFWEKFRHLFIWEGRS